MVTAAIEVNPSVDRFEEARSLCPNYKWTHGAMHYHQHALLIAAAHDHLALINHIVKKGGKELLSLGNQFGWTALFQACIADKYDAAELLLNLGANPNIATSRSSSAAPDGATPLWAVAQKTQDVALAELLLKYGAIPEPELNEEGQKVLREAKKTLRQETFAAISPAFLEKTKFPLELIGLVEEYVGPLPPTPLPAKVQPAYSCRLF